MIFAAEDKRLWTYNKTSIDWVIGKAQFFWWVSFCDTGHWHFDRRGGSGIACGVVRMRIWFLMFYKSLRTPPLKGKAVKFYCKQVFSPVKGEIWVVNCSTQDFSSPVGTQYGYFNSMNTHITSLRDSENLGISHSTHITPLAGLLHLRK